MPISPARTARTIAVNALMVKCPRRFDDSTTPSMLTAHVGGGAATAIAATTVTRLLHPARTTKLHVTRVSSSLVLLNSTSTAPVAPPQMSTTRLCNKHK